MGENAKRKSAHEVIDFEALRLRLGEDQLRRRLLRQADLWADSVHQGEGIFRLEKYIDFDRFVELCLKLGLVYWWGNRNFRSIEVVKNVVAVPDLPTGLEGFRLLQLSDLHLDLDPRLADVIIGELHGLPADLAVITGDYRNSIKDDYGPAIDPVARIVGAIEAPVYGVLGNHDFIEMVDWLEDAGMRMLLNEVAIH